MDKNFINELNKLTTCIFNHFYVTVMSQHVHKRSEMKGFYIIFLLFILGHHAFTSKLHLLSQSSSNQY